jgi:hypothetical protein
VKEQTHLSTGIVPLPIDRSRNNIPSSQAGALLIPIYPERSRGSVGAGKRPWVGTHNSKLPTQNFYIKRLETVGNGRETVGNWEQAFRYSVQPFSLKTQTGAAASPSCHAGGACAEASWGRVHLKIITHNSKYFFQNSRKQSATVGKQSGEMMETVASKSGIAVVLCRLFFKRGHSPIPCVVIGI